MNCPFRGSYVALPTPFRAGELDREALAELVEFHAGKGTDGLVVAGTSGECATLSDYERRTLIETVVECSHGLLPVIAGTGTNDTRRSIEMTAFAQEAGADGALCVTPYYNRPSQRGLALHFGAIAESTSLPIVLYNVPARTGCDLETGTVAAVRAAHPNVVALKDATGSLERAREHVAQTDLALFAGDDHLIRELLGLGASGVIGVVGNLAPREVAELCRAALPSGDPGRAEELWDELAPLVRDLFLESNPVPMKAALAFMGLCSDEVRLPLAGLDDDVRERLHVTLREAGLN